MGWRIIVKPDAQCCYSVRRKEYYARYSMYKAHKIELSENIRVRPEKNIASGHLQTTRHGNINQTTATLRPKCWTTRKGRVEGVVPRLRLTVPLRSTSRPPGDVLDHSDSETAPLVTDCNMSHLAPEPDTEMKRGVTEQMAVAKPQRVLGCRLCSQRKKKCDRSFPCSNCVRAGAQCVPVGTLAPRQRRRRFPERDLLERLRHYESLLRQNNINYEPLHPHEHELEEEHEQASPSEDTKGSDTLGDTPSDVSRDISAISAKSNKAVYVCPKFHLRVRMTDFPSQRFLPRHRQTGKSC